MGIQAVVAFGQKLVSHRSAIFSLATRSAKNRFIGTGAGVIWSIVNPLATVFIFWMVFSVGLKAQGPQGIPFDVYFITGLLPWILVTESLTSSVSAVVGNAYLVKKMVFPTETLPLVEILASTFGHLILLAFTIALLLIHNIVPGWGLLQLAYAYLCAVVLALGLGWLLAAINVFHRDIGQSLGTLINFWFWMTPVAWDVNMIPEFWRPLMYLNPAYHIVESYRAALLYNRPAWENLSQMAVFWSIALLLGLCGAYVFRRLKPEFADML